MQSTHCCIHTSFFKALIAVCRYSCTSTGKDGRVSRNILSTSSIQSDVWDHPREVDTVVGERNLGLKSEGGLGEERDVGTSC